jgi:hypothetical protein
MFFEEKVENEKKMSSVNLKIARISIIWNYRALAWLLLISRWRWL